MQHRELDAAISVSGQISTEDIASIAGSGFKSIICNRPDGESADQTPYALIEAAALGAGLPIRNIPVISGAITMDDVVAMKQAMAELPKPIYAYCRSGARCTNLYMMVQQLPD